MSHYFDDDPSIGSSPAMIDVSLPDVGFSLQSDRGVFSHGHVDTGTRVLLTSAPAPAAGGALLDLGCGTGAIAMTLALRSPDATVWAVDVNARARALTRDNAVRNGVTNIAVCEPDAVPADVSFATIWSNPPIRIGKRALHEMLTTWLVRLAVDGEAILVVHKHLGADSLQRWLTDSGFPTERLTSRAGFRLLRTTRAR